jgi:hypothetical protein
MPLVQMHDRRLDAEGGERAHASHAEDTVLDQPRVPIADVQPGGDPSVDRVIVGAIRVEQVERHAAHVDTPHVDAHDTTAHGDVDRQRFAVWPADAYRGQALEVGGRPPLVLPAAHVQPLVGESTLPDRAAPFRPWARRDRRRPSTRRRRGRRGRRRRATGPDGCRTRSRSRRWDGLRRCRAPPWPGGAARCRLGGQRPDTRDVAGIVRELLQRCGGVISIMARGFSPQRVHSGGSMSRNTAAPPRVQLHR